MLTRNKKCSWWFVYWSVLKTSKKKKTPLQLTNRPVLKEASVWATLKKTCAITERHICFSTLSVVWFKCMCGGKLYANSSQASGFFSITDDSKWCWSPGPVRAKRAANISIAQQLTASSLSANSVRFPASVFTCARMCPITSCPPLIKCIQREEENASKAFLRLIREPPQIPKFPPVSIFSTNTSCVCETPSHLTITLLSLKLTRSTLISANMLFPSTKAPYL